jgi:DNA-directed RNA polymerase subunit RPC12/RpoP
MSTYRIRKCKRCGREVQVWNEELKSIPVYECRQCRTGDVAHFSNHIVKSLLEKANQTLNEIKDYPIGNDTYEAIGPAYEQFVELSQRVHKLLSEAGERNRHNA